MVTNPTVVMTTQNPITDFRNPSMPRSTRALFSAFIIGAAITACGPRKAEVRTAPTAASSVTVEVQNHLAQGVNVYVVQNNNKTFLRQVNANSTVQVPVQGFASGTTVGLEATTIDGIKTYSRSNVTLTGTIVFPLP
jgi:hypothetical protein